MGFISYEKYKLLTPQDKGDYKRLFNAKYSGNNLIKAFFWDIKLFYRAIMFLMLFGIFFKDRISDFLTYQSAIAELILVLVNILVLVGIIYLIIYLIGIFYELIWLRKKGYNIKFKEYELSNATRRLLKWKEKQKTK